MWQVSVKANSARFCVWIARKLRGDYVDAQEINQRILDTKSQKIRTYPCNNLRASNIGHPCERYLYLLIKRWDEQKPHDIGLQQIFDLGNHLELHAINALKDAGYEVITPTQRSWKIEKPLITGREDIRIKEPDTGLLFPAEIKWLSPLEYEKLNSPEDFYNSKRHYVRGYPSQLLSYMYYFSKEKGYFVLGNKLTGAIKVIDFPLDWDRADALLKKGERIYAALKAKDVDTLSITEDFTVCDRCNLAHVCGAEIIRTEADVDVSGELEDLLVRREEILPYISEMEDIKRGIKTAMRNCDKIITGNYYVQKKVVMKKPFIVAGSVYTREIIRKIGK